MTALKKPILATLIAILLTAGAAYALKVFGRVNVAYEIVPPAESPELEPNPIELNLGTIPSGSTGLEGFGKIGRLTLPAGYKITFELNTATAQHSEKLEIVIELYKEGEHIGCVLLTLSFPEDSIVLDPGTYDLEIEVRYAAKSVTSKKAGTIVIYAMRPG